MVPLVTDFGLARRLDETGSVLAAGFEGTAAYMAPEQARAAPRSGDHRRRRLWPGRHPVRIAHGPTAVPRRNDCRDAGARADARSGTAEANRPAPQPRPGDNLPEMPGKGAGPALPVGSGPCGRPGELAGQPADQRPPGGSDRAQLALVSPQPGAGRRGRRRPGDCRRRLRSYRRLPQQGPVAGGGERPVGRGENPVGRGEWPTGRRQWQPGPTER